MQSSSPSTFPSDSVASQYTIPTQSHYKGPQQEQQNELGLALDMRKEDKDGQKKEQEKEKFSDQYIKIEEAKVHPGQENVVRIKEETSRSIAAATVIATETV